MHILTTNQLNAVIINRFETKHAAGVAPKTKPPEQAERPKVGSDIQWSTHTQNKRSSDLDVPTLMAACPEFADVARSLCGYLKNLNDVHRAAGLRRFKC